MIRRAFLAAAAGALLVACRSRVPVTGGAGASAEAARAVASLRGENGLPPLGPDARLERAALQQSRLMAGSGRMSHDAARGHGFAARMREGGIAGPAAENVAHARWGVDEVLGRWMTSPGHRRNMLDARFSRFGLAHAPDPDGSGRLYWTMVLSA